MGEVTAIQKENPLGTKPIDKLLLAFSVSPIIVCLINSVCSIMDQISIGQGVGYLGNATTTVSFPMMTTVMTFATLAGSGGGAYAAIKLGERNEHEVNVTLNNLFTVPLIIGIAISGLGLLFLDPLLRIFGATGTIMPYARNYASTVLMEVSFSALGVTMSNMARTDGNLRLSMYGILTDAALSAILNPLYIFVFHWGMKEAAIATITPQTLSAGVLCCYSWKRGNIRFQPKLMKLMPGACKGFLMMGASSGISQLVVCVIQVVMNNSLVHYGNQSEVAGDVTLGTMEVVMKIVMTLGSSCIDTRAGSQPILEYNYGTGNYKRIRSTYGEAIIYAIVSVSVGWLIYQTIPHLILSLLESGNAQFTQFTVKCMRIYLGGLFYSGFQIVSTDYFQTTGQPLETSILSVMQQLILPIPLLSILPLFFGLNGILYTEPVADIGSAIVVVCFVIPSIKRLNRQIQEKERMEKTQGCLVGASV